MTRPLAAFFFLAFALAASCGCNRAATAQVAPPEPTAVPVSQPVQREVTDFIDFTGRTDAVESVNIVPRVTGYLTQIHFKEGSEVKKGQLLFVIDPRPYEAQLNQAKSQLSLYQAQFNLAQATLARYTALSKSTPGAVSQQELDQYRASVAEAQASIQAAQASVEVYRLNVEFCNVTSPIDGLIGRYFYTLGNLVNQDQTLLTRIVSIDPMYAYFDMDEPTFLEIKRAINEGKIPRPSKTGGHVPIFMGLQGEQGYPHDGTVDFLNNQVNPTTGSILVRGIFANPAPPNGTHLLTPGLFVRIHLPIGPPHPALLVIDRAIGSDQGLKYVYVLGQDNKLEYRRISTGALQDDGLRVVTDGLKPGEWVVVGSLQQIHPNMQVQPEQMPMPTLGPGAATQAPTAGNQPAQQSQQPTQGPKQP